MLMKLDADDRRLLGKFAIIVVTGATGITSLALAAGFAVRLFVIAAGG